VFITIDPERDSGKLINEYVKEFHPRMIGLRGSLEEIKKVAKLFRVYFMKTNDSKTDYLVDHSIIMVCSSSTVLCCVLLLNVFLHVERGRSSKRVWRSPRIIYLFIG
jgi:cytochrome oxidase Cu insertion factor (SCO1/SenC/PrrC family)